MKGLLEEPSYRNLAKVTRSTYVSKLKAARAVPYPTTLHRKEEVYASGTDNRSRML